MLGVSFAELLVIAVVSIFLFYIRSLTKFIKLFKQCLAKCFEVRDEILDKFSDVRDLFKDPATSDEYIVGENKVLHKTVKLKACRFKIKK